MTLSLPLLYFVWTEEYCQTNPNKNKPPNLWHVTSILICCIFVHGPRTCAVLNWVQNNLYTRIFRRCHKDFSQILGCFTNLMTHGFQDLHFFSNKKPHNSWPCCTARFWDNKIWQSGTCLTYSPGPKCPCLFCLKINATVAKYVLGLIWLSMSNQLRDLVVFVGSETWTLPKKLSCFIGD